MRAERVTRLTPGYRDSTGDGRAWESTGRPGEDASSLGTLFRQLSDDATTLVREEVTLAKLELRREAQAITSDLVQVGGALGLAILGAFAMTAFLIMVIGDLLDAYWAGALIVGVLFLVGAGLWGRSAMQNLKKHARPPQDTMETLREDVRWAKQEAREFKREVTR